MGCGASKKADATAVAVPVQSKPSDPAEKKDSLILPAQPYNNENKTPTAAPAAKPATTSHPTPSQHKPTSTETHALKDEGNPTAPSPIKEATLPSAGSSKSSNNPDPAAPQTSERKQEPAAEVEKRAPSSTSVSIVYSGPDDCVGRPVVVDSAERGARQRALPVLPFSQCPSIVTWYTVSRETKPFPRTYSSKQALAAAREKPAVPSSSQSYGSLPSVVSWLPQNKVQRYGSLPSVVSWLPQTRAQPTAAPVEKPLAQAAKAPAPVEAMPVQVEKTPEASPAQKSNESPQPFDSLPSVVSWNQVRPAPAAAVTATAPVVDTAKPEAAGAFSSMPSVVTWQLPARKTDAAQAGPSAAASEPADSKAGAVKHTLILIRHGESQWNVENRFTGWVDVPLAPTGEAESHRAAAAIMEEKLTCDVVYSSVLKRAIKTGMNILEDMDAMHVPMIKDWRLNERHYGALQGLNKAETVAEHGEDKVNVWRRSYDTPPPDMAEDHEFWSGSDRRYAALSGDELPKAESLKTVVDRFMPLWSETLAPAIQSGKKVMVAAHGNTLRALVKHLDDIPEDAISKLNIPTAVPLVYELDENLKPIRSSRSWDPLSGYYLGDQEQIAAAINGVAAQSQAKKE